jgi:hypothetical protein
MDAISLSSHVTSAFNITGPSVKAYLGTGDIEARLFRSGGGIIIYG